MPQTIIRIPGKLVGDEYGTPLLDRTEVNDDIYGPYASVAAAHSALSAKGLNIIGQTIGINAENNTVVEYWYQGGTTQANLVEKEQGGVGDVKSINGISVAGTGNIEAAQADGEDFKAEGGVMKLKDKAYVPADFSGLGRVYLRKNMINASLHFYRIVASVSSTETDTLYGSPDEIIFVTEANKFMGVKNGSIGPKYYPNWSAIDSDAYITPDNKHRYVCDANAKLYTWESSTLTETTTLMDKNVLTQAMISKPNTIYVIQYDHDIVDLEETTTTNNLTINGEYYSYKPITIADNQTYRALNDCVFIDYQHNSLIGSVLVTGENESQDFAIAKKSSVASGVPVSYYKPDGTITIPANCVLQFEGGSIKNGTIVGNGTAIVADLVQIFNKNINITGIWNVTEAYPEWFGAVGDGVIDDRDIIQKIFNTSFDTIVLKKDYLIFNAPYDYTGYNPAWEEMDYIDDLNRQYTNGFTAKSVIINTKKTIVLSGSIKQYSPLCDLFIVNAPLNLYGGGKIEGYGLVDTRNAAYDGVESWDASLIQINTSDVTINNITFVNPVRDAISIGGRLSIGLYQNITVTNCVFGGGLVHHTAGNFTHLMGVTSYGTYVTIRNCSFIPINGRSLYTGVYVYANLIKAVNTIIEGNMFKGCLEHAIYCYGNDTKIHNNSCIDVRHAAIQCFCVLYSIKGNTIDCYTTEDDYSNAMLLSGYGDVIENKIYNCSGIPIRSIAMYNSTPSTQCTPTIKDNYIEKLNTHDSANQVGAAYPAIYCIVEDSVDRPLIVSGNIIDNKDATKEQYLGASIYIQLSKKVDDQWVAVDIPCCEINNNTISNSPNAAILINNMYTDKPLNININGNKIKNWSQHVNSVYQAIRLTGCKGNIDDNIVVRDAVGSIAIYNVAPGTGPLVFKGNFFNAKYSNDDVQNKAAYSLIDSVIDLGNVINDENTNGGLLGFFVNTTGRASDRPANPVVGQKFYDTRYNKQLTWNGSKWADENGFSNARSSGLTRMRPSGGITDGDLNVTDIGFPYFDTELGKIIYAKEINTSTGVVTWVDAVGENPDTQTT